MMSILSMTWPNADTQEHAGCTSMSMDGMARAQVLMLPLIRTLCLHSSKTPMRHNMRLFLVLTLKTLLQPPTHPLFPLFSCCDPTQALETKVSVCPLLCRLVHKCAR